MTEHPDNTIVTITMEDWGIARSIVEKRNHPPAPLVTRKKAWLWRATFGAMAIAVIAMISSPRIAGHEHLDARPAFAGIVAGVALSLLGARAMRPVRLEKEAAWRIEGVGISRNGLRIKMPHSRMLVPWSDYSAYSVAGDMFVIHNHKGLGVPIPTRGMSPESRAHALEVLRQAFGEPQP